MLKTIFWFNPLLYFYKKAIQLNHEFLADEAVVSKDNVTTYQNILLQMASGSHCISLASNLNFSVTKKRFIMITKTTPKRKCRLLKLATIFIATGITYFISTETVTYAKGTEAPSFFQQFNITKDTIAGDARRDEYFSGVKIIIQDSLRNVFVNAPYEKLTDEQKKEIAELDSLYSSKIAQREIFLKGEIAKAEMSGDFEAIEQLQKQLGSERKTMAAELEEKKEKVRKS